MMYMMIIDKIKSLLYKEMINCNRSSLQCTFHSFRINIRRTNMQIALPAISKRLQQAALHDWKEERLRHWMAAPATLEVARREGYSPIAANLYSYNSLAVQWRNAHCCCHSPQGRIWRNSCVLRHQYNKKSKLFY